MSKVGRLYSLCRGTANTKDCGYKYWQAWELGQLGATAVAEPKLVGDWDCDPTASVASGPQVDWMSCEHRGQPLRTEVCTSCCGGGVKVKVFACEVLKECTIGKKIDGVPMCYGCGSFSESKAKEP